MSHIHGSIRGSRTGPLSPSLPHCAAREQLGSRQSTATVIRNQQGRAGRAAASANYECTVWAAPVGSLSRVHRLRATAAAECTTTVLGSRPPAPQWLSPRLDVSTAVPRLRPAEHGRTSATTSMVSASERVLHTRNASRARRMAFRTAATFPPLPTSLPTSLHGTGAGRTVGRRDGAAPFAD